LAALYLNYPGLHIVGFSAVPHKVSTLAGEVEDPSKTFHKALVGGLVLVVSSYLIPFLAVTGALRVCSKLK